MTTLIEEVYPNIAQENILSNGGFEVWQRGAGPFACSPVVVFGPDEWECRAPVATADVSQDTSNQLFGDSCAKLDLTVNPGGTDEAYLQTGIENYEEYSGLWMTFSAWVKADLIGACEIRLYDYNGVSMEVVASAKNSTTSWELLTVTKEIRPSLSGSASLPHNTGLAVSVVRDVGTGVLYADGAMLVVGNIPQGARYVPLHPCDEMERCQRYFENSLDQWTRGTRAEHSYGNMVGYSRYSEYVNFSVRKDAVPTVTFTDIGYPQTPRSGGLSMDGSGIEGFVWGVDDDPASSTWLYNRAYFRWSAEVQ